LPDRTVKYLIIGGGLAAANCARHLREEGADGEVLIVGRELDPPYNRPPLTKTYMRSVESREEILFRPDEWYEEQNVEVLTRTTVMKLDAEERFVTLSNKQEIGFEKALLATGANVRILHAEGAALDGIHYLRTMRNADAIKEELESAERVAVIGGSYIGTELAASFTKIGKHCELIMLEAVTHERFYGPEVGRYFHDLLVEHGVRIHGSQELERFEGSERVERVVTKSGLAVDCDVVVIGAGVHPDIHLAEQAGIETDQGVLTDRYLETSAPGIFAAGDIAEYDSVVHRRRIRIEHWDVAFNQGKYAALNMLGQQKVYDVVPYFWSDLADWGGMEYVGPASEWDEVWFRGTVAEGRFTAWYVKDGKVAAALTVGRSDDLTVAAQLLAAGIDVRAHRALIEDPSADLSALLDQGG
jgi:3-phenylpropionate/trans-cinnamate dioxygenase ferredoxin reductase component